VVAYVAGLRPIEICHLKQGVGLGDSKPPGRIAFLGDFPPRPCGIATFTKDLCEAVVAAAPDSQCFVAAVNDRAEGYDYPERVWLELQEKELGS